MCRNYLFLLFGLSAMFLSPIAAQKNCAACTTFPCGNTSAVVACATTNVSAPLDALAAKLGPLDTFTKCLIMVSEKTKQEVRSCVPEKMGDVPICEALKAELKWEGAKCGTCPAAERPCNSDTLPDDGGSTPPGNVTTAKPTQGGTTGAGDTGAGVSIHLDHSMCAWLAAAVLFKVMMI